MPFSPTYILADHCFLPLGDSTKDCWNKMMKGQGSVSYFQDEEILKEKYQASKWTSFPEIDTKEPATVLEKMAIYSIDKAIQEADIDPKSENVIFIAATTKGNIHLLASKEKQLEGRERLGKMAGFISNYFENKNQPFVISNACISGVLALQTAHQLLNEKWYDHAIVFGLDLVSRFTLSGFNAFKAVSKKPCKPFDKERDGISLGEGAATIILSQKRKSDLQLLGAATSNDANHISGPSRDGSGLKIAIQKTMESVPDHFKPDFISTHGTATIYNDEMEALALSSAGFESVPLHSIKGFVGHTLGAAGLVESCILLESMRQNKAPGTKGFENRGVSEPINICKNNFEGKINMALKTASGFGGCNAAAAFSKI